MPSKPVLSDADKENIRKKLKGLCEECWISQGYKDSNALNIPYALDSSIFSSRLAAWTACLKKSKLSNLTFFIVSSGSFVIKDWKSGVLTLYRKGLLSYSLKIRKYSSKRRETDMPSKPVLSDADKENIRKRLKELCEECWIAQGYKKTSIKSLCERAGISGN